MNNTVEINKICRLCLADEEVNVRIFHGKGKEEQVYLKISTCLPIQISPDDNFPKNICDDCSDKVNIMYRLWNTSASSEKKLFEWFEQWDTNNKNTDSEIIDLTDIDFETLIDVGLSKITVKEPCKYAKDTQDKPNDILNQDDYIEEQLPHSTTLSEVEKEPCSNATDTEDLQDDHFNQNIHIEELPHGTILELVEEEFCNNTTNTQDFQNDNSNQEFFIEELPRCTTLEIVEEEHCKNTTDTQDSQNDSLNHDVSIEELPHHTTLEIVYSNTPEERLEDEQEDIWKQELEFSSAELPSSTTLETVSNETVEEVQPITTCIVPTCDGNKNNTKKVFHPLPANEEIRNIWLKLISRSDLLEKPYHDLQQARVCGAHFDEAQYLSKTKQFRCIVANCDGITNNKRRTWHTLPKDYELREKWLLILKRPDLQNATSALNKVCSAHFAPWQFRSPVSETLNFRSVPLFIQDEEETSNATTSPTVILTKQSPTPTKLVASKENGIPGKQLATAKKRLALSPKQNATLRRQLTIAKKRLANPSKQNSAPEKQPTTAKKRLGNPSKQNSTPEKPLTTVKKRLSNPAKRLVHTPKQNATPGKPLAISAKRRYSLRKFHISLEQ